LLHEHRREGDLVTITSRQDLIRALNEAVIAGESLAAGHGPRLGQQMLPALRISVVEVPEVGVTGCCRADADSASVRPPQRLYCRSDT
jgi:hypothetical protein